MKAVHGRSQGLPDDLELEELKRMSPSKIVQFLIIREAILTPPRTQAMTGLFFEEWPVVDSITRAAKL